MLSKKTTRALSSGYGNKQIANSKHSQEEMVGFVLIIILVAVIVLIFLSLSMRKPVGMQRDQQIESFLHSSLIYTTKCKKSPEVIYDFKGLIGACYNGEDCLESEDSCEMLNQTAAELIENSFNIGEDSRYKGYIFRIDSKTGKILVQKEGEESLSSMGADVHIPVSGENVNITLKLFY